MLPSILFGGFLIALAGGMALLHIRAGRAAERGGLSEPHLAFARRQCRRRLQICLLLAVIGAAIMGGVFMTQPLLSVAYWICVVVIVLWMGFLALADLLSSQAHLRTVRDEYKVEHAALKAELAKYLAEQGSGAADFCPPRKSGV